MNGNLLAILIGTQAYDYIIIPRNGNNIVYVDSVTFSAYLNSKGCFDDWICVDYCTMFSHEKILPEENIISYWQESENRKAIHVILDNELLIDRKQYYQYLRPGLTKKGLLAAIRKRKCFLKKLFN